MKKQPVVMLLMRHELPGYYSIERLFGTLVPFLSENFEIRIVRVPCPSSGAWRCLRNMLFTARLRADVIHVTGDIQYCALAVSRRRCVLTVHDLRHLTRLGGLRKRVFLLLWYELPLRWACYVTAISDETRRQLQREFPGPGRRVEVILNCVDPAFRRGTSSAAASPGKPRVLQVGTGANKNLERVARAASSLPLHLRVIGPVSKAQRKVLELAGVDWSSLAELQWEDLLCEYLNSDVLMFASTYEGFGLPIVEAQAIGLPVITSDIPPMKEVAGDGALLVNPYDEGNIRGGLEAVLRERDLARRLIDLGHENVKRFDAQLVSRQYAAVYLRALGGIR